MKFSIVITTYNRLELLKRAIACSLEQTFPCEVVVVDDCSQDGTEAYVRELSASLEAAGDLRLVYHRNPENLGHSQSVNAGVQQASGDWIKGLDDDDYLALTCIETLSAAIALRPQAVICSCQAAQVNEQEQPLSVTDRVGSGEICYIPQEDIHCGMLLEQVPFGTPVQVAFRRDAFLRSGGWDSRLDANFDDIDSWVKIAQFGDAIFVNRCLAYRTIWTGAYNRRFSLAHRLETHIGIKRKIHALVPDLHRPQLPSMRALEAYLKLHWALIALRQGDWPGAARFSATALWFPPAWGLLLQRQRRRSAQDQSGLSPTGAFLTLGPWPHPARLRLLRNYLALRSGWRALRAGKLAAAGRAAVSAGSSWRFWYALTGFLRGRLAFAPPFLQGPGAGNRRLLGRLSTGLAQPVRRSLATIHELRLYMKLRLVQLAWQAGHWGRVLRFGLPLLLRPAAWGLVLKLRRYQAGAARPASRIRTVVLSDW